MNPYQMPVECSVCGGEGVARYGRGHPWLDDFTHKDPRVCADILEAKREKEKREIKDMAAEIEGLKKENQLLKGKHDAIQD